MLRSLCAPPASSLTGIEIPNAFVAFYWDQHNIFLVSSNGREQRKEVDGKLRSTKEGQQNRMVWCSHNMAASNHMHICTKALDPGHHSTNQNGTIKHVRINRLMLAAPMHRVW